MRFVPFLLITAVTAAPWPAAAGSPELLELTLDEVTLQGKVVARNRNFCWLMTPDGQLKRLERRDIQQIEPAGERFRGLTIIDMRNALRKEFDRSFEIETTQHYVVCAPEGKAEPFAEVFETIYRRFTVYFAARGFRLSRPEFPLVAIVFPDYKSFREHSKTVGVNARPGLKGYYLPASNRVILYDSSRNTAAGRTDQTGETPPEFRFPLSASGFPFPPAAYARIEGNLQATLIHEATHQMAFNTGLHTRIGENPIWVIEGLALSFESPGIRNRSRSYREKKINPARLAHFREFVKKRREEKSLAEFIQRDDMFRRDPYDAYGQAWALSYYLIETRSARYTRYLKKIAGRDPLEPYTAEERLDDFTDTFGRNLDLFEATWLRYFKRME